MTIQVHMNEPLGANTLLHGNVSDTREAITVSLPGVHLDRQGEQTMTFSVADEDVHLFDPDSGKRLEA